MHFGIRVEISPFLGNNHRKRIPTYHVEAQCLGHLVFVLVLRICWMRLETYDKVNYDYLRSCMHFYCTDFRGIVNTEQFHSWQSKIQENELCCNATRPNWIHIRTIDNKTDCHLFVYRLALFCFIFSSWRKKSTLFWYPISPWSMYGVTSTRFVWCLSLSWSSNPTVFA